MDAYQMVQLLLPGVELTSGQLAQVRALDYRLTTARGRRTPEEDMAEIRASVAADIRAMLTADQCNTFDQNFARVRADILGS